MEFRALRAEELEAWYDHVTFVFQGSRRYFMNHWENDPWKDLEGIRVAVDEGRIVSTVRVFFRQMYLHGQLVSVGGIGEVSTHPDYRRRGLASHLLQDAIRLMQERGIALSCLHGSRSLYETLGWHTVTRYYARARKRAAEARTLEVSRADLEDSATLQALAPLHDRYARRFNGIFARNAAYWRDWFRTEARQVWLAHWQGDLVGYAALDVHEEALRIREFGVSDEMFIQDQGREVLDAVVGHVLAVHGYPSAEVTWPAPVAGGFEAEHIEERNSTKYRPICLDPRTMGATTLEELLHQPPDAGIAKLPSHHVLWDTDGF